MKITKTRTYEIKYSIEYCEATEGGMDSEVYKDEVDDIKDAIEWLEMAERADKSRPWMIVCSVSKEIK